MTKREARRLELAEDTCRAFRCLVGKRVCDQTQSDVNDVMDYLNAWMRIGPRKWDRPSARIRRMHRD